jgi:hypothetical protein
MLDIQVDRLKTARSSFVLQLYSPPVDDSGNHKNTSKRTMASTDAEKNEESTREGAVVGSSSSSAELASSVPLELPALRFWLLSLG